MDKKDEREWAGGRKYPKILTTNADAGHAGQSPLSRTLKAESYSQELCASIHGCY